ncbi:MAG: hypothetical protein M1834_005262 [Cirrosporium novae-zelandiae]|nr:MAG: hypothetical protein M1834_005262 [Cirrosporium novae-zelandiae]
MPQEQAYYAMYVARSDGKLSTMKKDGREDNCPSKEQRDKKPNEAGVQDYYEELDSNAEKAKDWRRKLGGMLVQELLERKMMPEEQRSLLLDEDGNRKLCVLENFPENYRLYEHIKKKAEKSDKSHAAGDADRRDAYLYGHPYGRKSRFRSPADFFHHLWWLVTDESGDEGNCCCKVCAPNPADSGSTPTTKSSSAAAVAGAITPTPTPGLVHRAAVPVDSGVSATKSNNNTPSVPNTPPALPPFTYRIGEMLWVKEPETAYSICIATNHQYKRLADSSVVPIYTIRCLSHPYFHPAEKESQNGLGLKPFRCFQVPPPEIVTYTGHTYKTVDWNSLSLAYKQNPRFIEQEAMKFAAIGVDRTYTLEGEINASSNIEGNNNPNIKGWKSLYLGAEKILPGDPIRLESLATEYRTALQQSGHMGHPQILVLQKIFEEIDQQGNSKISLVGDLYIQVPATDEFQSKGFTPQDERLPADILRTLVSRNHRALQLGGRIVRWLPFKPRYVANINDVSGRWYDYDHLANIFLATEELKQSFLRGGSPPEPNEMFFITGHCCEKATGNERTLQRTWLRREAFGESVPQQTLQESSGGQGTSREDMQTGAKQE